MPRIGRLHIPGGYYHLMGRGLERRNIFLEDTDKSDFLRRLGKALDSCGMQCLAWALMSNHYHLLVRINTIPLSKLMSSVLGGYASSYNRRHRRVGYVFQNRYKSILCDSDNYLLQLIRYIHLNPVRAGMVENVNELAVYKWTGHAGMLGKHKQRWHAVDLALCQFGLTVAVARRAYIGFIQKEQPWIDLESGGLVRSHGGWESLTRLRREHEVCIGDERILGGSEFVEKALAQDELWIQQKSLLEQHGWTLEKLIERVSDHFGVGEQALLTKARSNNISAAKALICYWGTRKLGLTCREIAKRLNISRQAASTWVSKGELLCEQENLQFEKDWA